MNKINLIEYLNNDLRIRYFILLSLGIIYLIYLGYVHIIQIQAAFILVVAILVISYDRIVKYLK